MIPVKYSPRVEYYKRHRGLIETSNDLLKNKANIQHTRHRSTINFEVNIWVAINTYTYNDKLPLIKTFKQNIKPLTPIQNQMQLSITA